MTLARTDAGWQLRRGGQPYRIRGAGGEKHLELLAAGGGNSIRTWGADAKGGLLDKAEALGLTVTLGIWLGHKEHGFRYDDPKQRAAQREAVCGQIARYKDHPALLLWALGNEMEGDGADEDVWRHLEELAQAVKRIDPNHPVMTVVAEVNEVKIAHLKRLCPSIDLLGVNAYGGVTTLPERLEKLGWEKPYLVTEFGPHGPWEGKKTPWGAPVEPSSTQKAALYQAAYERAVLRKPGQCLGGYAFFWDDKFEATATWFGMFLPATGERLGPADTMARLWGKPFPNRVPEIAAFACEAAEKDVAPGALLTARVEARDPEGDPLRVRYELRREDGSYLTELPGRPGVPFTLAAPGAPGAYRLFVTVRDGRGGAATANIPFRVAG